MKQIITNCVIVGVFMFLLTSCSSDDSNKGVDYPVVEKIIGKWYMKAVSNNGDTTPYNHACANAKDYKEFLQSGWLKTIKYDSECEIYQNSSVDWSVKGDVVTTNFFDPIIDNLRKYTVIKLTDEELVLKVRYNKNGQFITEVSYYTRN